MIEKIDGISKIHESAQFDAEFFARGKDYTGWVWDTLRRRLTELGIDYKKAKVLDVACGNGRATRGMRAGKDGFTDVTGVDPNVDMLKDAISRGDDIPYIKAFADDLPYADGKFDVITIYSAFNFFGNDERTMHEISRVLKPGGVLMVITQKPGAFTQAGRALIAKYAKRAFEKNPGAAPVGVSSARILEEKYGFKNIVTDEHDEMAVYSVKDAPAIFEKARGRKLMNVEDIPAMEEELKRLSEQSATEDPVTGKKVVSQTARLIVDIAQKPL